MRRVVMFLFLCLAAVWAGFGRFPFTPRFLAEPAGGATGLLLALGLFSIAIAAAVRK